MITNTLYSSLSSALYNIAVDMIDLYYDIPCMKTLPISINANEDELKLSSICRVLCCGPRSFSGKEIQEGRIGLNL